MPWFALTTPMRLDEMEAVFARTAEEVGFPIRYFMPTMTIHARVGRRVVQRRQRLLGRYVFLNHDRADVDRLVAVVSRLHWISGEAEYLRQPIPERQMDNFIALARALKNNVDCMLLTDDALEPGDTVQIIGGDFDGISGTLQTTRGRDGGRVMLQVGNILMAVTPHIEPQYIRILEFAGGNRHPYRKFDAHLTRALEAVSTRRSGGELTSEQRGAMSTFARRFSELRPATVNLAATHAALMALTYVALGQGEDAECWLSCCRDLLPKVNAPMQRAQLLALMYTATADTRLRDQARTITDTWNATAGDSKRALIANLLSADI